MAAADHWRTAPSKCITCSEKSSDGWDLNYWDNHGSAKGKLVNGLWKPAMISRRP
ncbi:MAG: hypothetical protein ACLS6O_01515 [Bifidobacterium sp.]